MHSCLIWRRCALATAGRVTGRQSDSHGAARRGQVALIVGHRSEPTGEKGWKVLFARTTDLVQCLQVARRESWLSNLPSTGWIASIS